MAATNSVKIAPSSCFAVLFSLCLQGRFAALPAKTMLLVPLLLWMSILLAWTLPCQDVITGDFFLAIDA